MSRPTETDVPISAPRKSKKSLGGEPKTVGKSRQCPICHVYYKNGNSYWQHVRYVHARVLSQCVICEKSYKRTTMVKHHILHSHKIAWHLCSNYVRKIKKSDVPEKKNARNSKGKKNSTLKYFRKKTLHLISSFNCYYCPGSFRTITELFQHVKWHRNDSRENVSDTVYKSSGSDCETADSSYGKVDSSYKYSNTGFDKIDSSNADDSG